MRDRPEGNTGDQNTVRDEDLDASWDDDDAYDRDG